jgi:hypothetical protein
MQRGLEQNCSGLLFLHRFPFPSQTRKNGWAVKRDADKEGVAEK